MGHILDSNLTLLNRFYEVHRHLMALALKQPSIPYILSTLKNALHLDVTYYDTERDRRLSTGKGCDSFTAFSLRRRDPSQYQTHAYFSMQLFFADAPEAQDESRAAKQALAVRIPSSDAIDYYLIIHNDGKDLAPFDTMTIENIVSLLQMEILKQNAIKQKVFFQNNNTVHDLLLGRYQDEEKIDAALNGLGMDQYPFYEVLLIFFDLDDPADIDRQDEIHQAIRRKLRTVYPGMVFFVNGNRAVYLRNVRSQMSSMDIDAIETALADLHARSTLPPFTHLASLSGIHDRYSIDIANQEALDTHRLFEGTAHKNVCFRYDDLGIYRLMLTVGDASELNSFIDPRLKQLEAEHPDLFETLTKLCSNGIDYNKTASELFIHSKTVRYRVDRIKEIAGIDIKNPDDYLQIAFAEKILRITSGQF